MNSGRNNRRLGESTSTEKTPEEAEAQKCVCSRAQNSSFLKLKTLVEARMAHACELGAFILFVFLLVGGGTVCVAIGILNMRRCPLQANLPVYLTAVGVLMLLALPQVVLSSGRPVTTTSHFLHLLYKAVLCVSEFVVLVFGTVAVSSAMPPNFDPSKGPHCSRICFLASLFLVTATWLFIILLGIFAVLLMCCYLFCGRTPKMNLGPSLPQE